MHIILARLLEAQSYSSRGHNCISAAFFLTGIDKIEQTQRERPIGYIQNYSRRLLRLQSVDGALLIGYYARTDPYYIVHLMTVHPSDSSKVIERHEVNDDMQIVPLESRWVETPIFGLAFFRLR
jgi:hypothetical protein